MTEQAFRTDHFTSGWWGKLKRVVQVGPAYYLHALPGHMLRRRKLGLGAWDAAAWTNPLRELRPTSCHDLPLPPFFDDVLSELVGARVRIAIPRLRFEALAGVWWSVREVGGDIIECGAYEGATALALALLDRCAGLDRTVHALDTFEGIPSAGAADPFRRAGEFALPADQVERLRQQAESLGVADRLRVYVGRFDQSFESLDDRTYALAHIDANVYHGTLDACRHCLPRLAAGGASVFDDYAGPFDLGARLAIDVAFSESKLLASEPDRLRALAWSSAVYQAPRSGRAI